MKWGDAISSWKRPASAGVATASLLLLASLDAHSQEWAEYGYRGSLGVGVASTADQVSADRLHSFEGTPAFVVGITPASLHAEFVHRIRLQLSASCHFGKVAGKVVSNGSEYDVGGQYFGWHSAVAAGGVLHVGRMRYYGVVGPVFVLPYSGDGKTSNQVHLESTLEPRTLFGVELGAEIPTSDKADSSTYVGGALRVERRLDTSGDIGVTTDGSGTRLRLDFEPVTTVTLNVQLAVWYL